MWEKRKVTKTSKKATIFRNWVFGILLSYQKVCLWFQKKHFLSMFSFVRLWWARFWSFLTFGVSLLDDENLNYLNWAFSSKTEEFEHKRKNKSFPWWLVHGALSFSFWGVWNSSRHLFRKFCFFVFFVIILFFFFHLGSHFASHHFFSCCVFSLLSQNARKLETKENCQWVSILLVFKVTRIKRFSFHVQF